MRRDLGDGLVLRWSTGEDTEDIAGLTSLVFREKEDDEPNQGLADTVRRSMRGDYPTMGTDDFLVVEDTRKDGNRIVACTCYLREDWEYDGVALPAARPEIVATLPGYRNRGLIRTLLDVIHERSARDGRIVQGITGIPYFYRQFGYEYAVDLGGRVSVPVSLLPVLPEGEQERYRLRPAVVDDIPSISACYRRHQAGQLVSRHLPDSFWRYHIEAEADQPPLTSHTRIRMIETSKGELCGFLFTPYRRNADTFSASLVGFQPGVNVHDVAPALMRELKRLGEEPSSKEWEGKPLQKLVLELGRDHPFYQAIRADWSPRRETPYAWYIRLPDLPGFLRLIAPVLERRLGSSSLAGFTGEVKLDFYRGGLRMCFDDGKLQTVENCRFEAYDGSAKGGFASLTFLRLVFGYSSLDDLRAAYPDVWVNHETEALLNALFPKRASHLFAY